MTTLILIVVFVIALLFVLGLQTSDKVSSSIEIDATAREVWDAVTNFDKFREWNPFITRVTGDFKEGEIMDVRIALPFSKSMDFKLTVLSIDSGREFVWKGETLGPRVLDGIHYFRIEDLGDGKVRFTQGEKFTGLLLYIVMLFIKSGVESNFIKMNVAIKNHVEGVVSVSETSHIPSGVA